MIKKNIASRILSSACETKDAATAAETIFARGPAAASIASRPYEQERGGSFISAPNRFSSSLSIRREYATAKRICPSSCTIAADSGMLAR